MKRNAKYIEIYRKYFPYVYNIIYTKIGNIQETEDLCQEIFIILYNNFNTVENTRKWLLGTIRNCIMKYFRDKKIDLDIDEIFDDISLTYVNGFKDTRILLKEILSEVITDESEQMLVDLIAVHNYSYQYVSKAMGITYKTVLYRYNKIVKKVTAQLQKKGISNLEDLL